MNPKLHLLAIATVLSFSEFANAGVLLYVHFGDNAPEFTTEEHLLQTTYTPVSSDFAANYYLRLTDGSTIFAYRFSVRFNDKLSLLSMSETRPDVFPLKANPNLFPTVKSGFNEINGFYGADPSVRDPNLPPIKLAGDGFYKLATTTFSLSPANLSIQGGFMPGERLVEPGMFELAPKMTNEPDVIIDIFNSDDPEYAPHTSFFPGVRGGSVPVASVPEPVSAIVFGALGVLTLFRRHRRVASV